jgi:hypothetical protein
MPTFTPVQTDTFTGVNGNDINTSGNWTTITGESGWLYSTAGTTASPVSTSADCNEYWSAGGTPGADQYSRANLTVVSTTGGGTGVGLSVRCDTAARTYYRFVIDHAASNNAEVHRFNAGSFAQVGASWTQAFTDGDQFTLAVEGSGTSTVVKVYNSALAEVFTATDSGGSAVDTGRYGLAHSSTTTGAVVDNWEGGTFSTSAGGPTPGTDTASVTGTDVVRPVTVTLSIQESG